jgi:hypothetical protein
MQGKFSWKSKLEFIFVDIILCRFGGGGGGDLYLKNSDKLLIQSFARLNSEGHKNFLE